MMRFAVVPVVILGACALASGALLAQGPRNIQPLALEDRAGFEPMFDGTSLAGWEGDTGFWRVEGGLLVGESTAAKPLPANTFLIWTKAQPADFELKMDFRITAGNTGVQYRSERAPDVGPYVLKGYQADIDFANQWTGQLYEERGRGFLALPGQATFSRRRQAAHLRQPDAGRRAEGGDQRRRLEHDPHHRAQANSWSTPINGKVSAPCSSTATRRSGPAKGFIGLQLHTGPPMRAEFRNVAIRVAEVN